MLCLFIELCLLNLACLIIILSLLVRMKEQVILYLHVTTVVLMIIFAPIVSIFVLKNLRKKLMLLEKMNQVLKNKSRS
jgi:hypothetical protein